MLANDNGEVLLEVLLDCTDSTARNACGDLWKWIFCNVKMIEKEALAGDDHAKTVSARMLQMLKNNLQSRAAKNWTKFDKFLELF